MSNQIQAPDAKDIVRKFGKFTLRPHQIDACAVFGRMNHRGLLLYYDMGSGKTLTALAAAQNLLLRNAITSVVIACPNAVIPQFKEHIEEMKIPKKPFTITTHRSLRPDAITGNTLLIIDEVHKLKGEETDYKIALKACSRARKVLAMTGTPLVNHPSDIAPIMALVNFDKIVYLITEGEEWRDYVVDSTQYILNSLSNLTKNKERDPGNTRPFVVKATTAFKRVFMFGDKNRSMQFNTERKNDLFEFLKCDIMYYAPDKNSRMYKDQYPSSSEYIVRVPMTKEQTEYQLSVAKKELSRIQKVFAVTDLKQLMSYFQKLRVHGDFAYDSTFWEPYGVKNLTEYIRKKEKEGMKLHDIDVPLPPNRPKLESIVKKIEETAKKNQKTVVYTAYKTEVHSILRTMLRIREISFGTIDSDISDRERDIVKQQYNNDEIKVLLLSPSGQVGLDLKNTSVMIVVEPDWNESSIQQAIARAIRSGSHDGRVPRHVDVYRYIATLYPGMKAQGNVFRVVGEKSADEHLQDIASRKQRVNGRMLRFMQRVSQYTVSQCEDVRFDSSNWNVFMKNAEQSDPEVITEDPQEPFRIERVNTPTPNQTPNQSSQGNVFKILQDQSNIAGKGKFGQIIVKPRAQIQPLVESKGITIPPSFQNVAIKIQNVSNSSKQESIVMNYLQENKFEYMPQFFGVLTHPAKTKKDKDKHIILMEQIPGKTIRAIWNTMTPQMAKQIHANLNAALLRMWSLGVIHTDLHKDNIMVTPTNQVYIIDFGLAMISATIRDRIKKFTAGRIGPVSATTIWDNVIWPYIIKEKGYKEHRRGRAIIEYKVDEKTGERKKKHARNANVLKQLALKK